MYKKFFRSVDTHNFENVKAYQEYLQRQKPYRTQEIRPETIDLTDDGMIKFGDNSMPMTQEGFTSMVTKVFKIPDPFANYIPFELLQQNIRGLRGEVDDIVTFILHPDNDIIINGVKGEHKFVRTLPILQHLEKYQIKHLSHSDMGSNIQLISNDMDFEVEPKPGDVTKIGMDIKNSETGFSNPVAHTLLWTLVCSNGAILPRRFGHVRISLKKADADADSIARRFDYKIRNMIENMEEVKTNLVKMRELSLTFKRANSLIKSLSRVTDKGTAFDMIGIEGEDYKEIRENAKDLELCEETSDINMYDTYSKITNTANHYKGLTRSRLQSIGGKFLTFEEFE